MVRYRYEPKQAGLICITDPWHQRIAYVDCRSGGAQEAFESLCREFERVGWQMEKRVFDRRYMRRDWIRWEVEIRSADPPPKGDGRGFMQLLADHYREQQ